MLGFALVFGVSLSWPCAVALECHNCINEAWHCIKHQLTWGVCHHVFFSSGFGLFAATVSRSVIQNAGKRGLIALIVFGVLGTGIVIQDIFAAHLLPYEMSDSCSRFEKQRVLRELAKTAGPDDSQLVEKSAQYLEESAIPTLSLAWKRCNTVALISGLLTWGLTMLCTTYVWYCVFGWRELLDDGRKRVQMAAVLLLLATWVPLREYANWFIAHEDRFLPAAPGSSNAIIGAVFALLTFVFLLIIAMIKQLPKDIVVTIGGAVIATISFLLMKFPSWLSSISDALEKMSIFAVIAACIVAIVLIGVIIRAWFDAEIASTGPSKKKPGKGAPK
jgi:hypothetical protein